MKWFRRWMMRWWMVIQRVGWEWSIWRVIVVKVEFVVLFDGWVCEWSGSSDELRKSVWWVGLIWWSLSACWWWKSTRVHWKVRIKLERWSTTPISKTSVNDSPSKQKKKTMDHKWGHPPLYKHSLKLYGTTAMDSTYHICYKTMYDVCVCVSVWVLMMLLRSLVELKSDRSYLTFFIIIKNILIK